MTTPDTSASPGSKKEKRIDVARKVFQDNLKDLPTLGDRQFRKLITTEVMQKTGCTIASAASMYNVCKHDAESDGLVSGLGRKGNDLKIVKTPETETVEQNTKSLNVS